MPITDYNKKKKLEVSSTNDSGTTQDKAQPILVEGEKGSAFDLDSASFIDSFDVSSEEEGPTGLAFSDTGDKLFVIGENKNKVYEYSLSTNFDVSTASFVDSFDVSAQDDLPQEIVFNNSGDKMFITGDTNNKVYEYSLSTGFDVSTASFVDSFDVSAQGSFPRGISFSDTGNKMFIAQGATDRIDEYSLSTNFDVSTASFVDSFDVSSQSNSVANVTFSDSGDKMFIVDRSDNKVYEYSLSTNFDVSTASFVDSFDVSGQDGITNGVVFGQKGNKMFVVGSENDSVYEYSIGRSESKTGTGDIVIDFTNITDAQDIAVYDQNGNLLDYEIESLDTSAETGVIWAYDSWVRDDTVQAQVAYGDNSANSDRQNVEGTWSNTGQGAEWVQHLQNDPLTATDSSPNNRDGTVTGATSTDGVFNGAGNFDGSDDRIDATFFDISKPFTLVSWFNVDDLSSFVGPLISIANSNVGDQQHRMQVNGKPDTVDLSSFDGSNNVVRSQQINTDTDFLAIGIVDSSSRSITVDETTNSNDEGDSITGVDRATIGTTADDSAFGFMDGTVDAVRIFSNKKDDSWRQSEFDASPKAGQVYFSQQAAEPTVINQTVTVPETQISSTNPDPQINATVDISIPTTTATTVNPAPTVSPGAAPLNLTASTASTANPDFTVQPGNTTVQTPVSTATVSNPDPVVNAFNEVTVPETTVATVNPAPTLTVGQTILTPETTVASSNPDLTVQPGETSLNISTTQVSASNPVIGLNRQIVVGVATNLESENPEPNLQAGAVSVQVPETTNLTENPALQVQPGATSLQTEQATSLQTVNPDFNTVSGAAELQVSETQLTASVQEPSIGLTLQFVSPTNALITNDERFFDMPDHTFTEGDLGDTLTATLKDDASPDGVDLTGATEISLVVKDRDGVKVFDKEMSIVDSSTGDVEYKWSESDFIEEPGVYRSKIKVFDSTGEPESFPNDGFRTIEVEEEIG